MLRLRRSKAQSTAEYAIVIGLVIAAVVAMQIYVKRGLQAKIKGAVDFKPYGADGVTGKNTTTPDARFINDQFEPDYTTTLKVGEEDGMHTTGSTEETTTIKRTGEVEKKIVGESTTSRTGTQVTK